MEILNGLIQEYMRLILQPNNNKMDNTRESSGKYWYI